MKITDINQLHKFIEQFNFATLVCHDNEELNISHIPVILNRKQGSQRTLVWHVAKQNPHSRSFDGTKNALFIFYGPHAYVSPSWYKSSPNVPTWNNAVVHAYGNPTQVSNEQLALDLSQMVVQHEESSNDNYIIPDSYKLKLIDHIVGFEMEILKIESRFKLGQNRSQEDQASMLVGLKNNGKGLALAEFIQSIQENYANETK